MEVKGINCTLYGFFTDVLWPITNTAKDFICKTSITKTPFQLQIWQRGDSLLLNNFFTHYWQIRHTYCAAILMNFLRSCTRLPTFWARTISVTTQYWISLKRRRNMSRLAVMAWKLCRPNTWYINSYWNRHDKYDIIRWQISLKRHRIMSRLVVMAWKLCRPNTWYISSYWNRNKIHVIYIPQAIFTFCYYL